MSQSEREDRRIRRRRKHRSSNHHSASAFWLDAVALLLIGAAFAACWLFFRGEWLLAWQVELGLIGLVAGGVGVALGLLRLRHHIRERRRWWAGAGCPRCGHTFLRRTPRRWYDRLVGVVSIPLRRYICTKCHWIGLRIDEQRLYR